MSSYLEQLSKYTRARDIALGASSQIPASENIVDHTSTTSGIVLADVNQHVILGARGGGSTITLPQATSANVGRTIKVSCAADCGTGVSYLGVAHTGTTVMNGGVCVTCMGGEGASEANEETSAYQPLVANAKRLRLDSDSSSAAGGAQGSTYTFTYYGPNSIFLQGEGYTTLASMDYLGSSVSETTGIP